jgi:predicted P-loop ATPase/GTPase
MGIRTVSDYVQFFIDLDMGSSVSFFSFVNNEKLTLKHKLQNKEIKKEYILEGLKILDELTSEIQTIGEKLVLEKYSNVKK